jgi:predicted nuclease of predicted toxin-antitoxin system
VRVLLDEQLPRQLAGVLSDQHEVRTVHQQGWSGSPDRDILRLAAEHGFGVFITADRNLEYQQNLAHRPFGILVLVARSNTVRDLLPLVGEILASIPRLLPGTVARIHAATNR